MFSSVSVSLSESATGARTVRTAVQDTGKALGCSVTGMALQQALHEMRHVFPLLTLCYVWAVAIAYIVIDKLRYSAPHRTFDDTLFRVAIHSAAPPPGQEAETLAARSYLPQGHSRRHIESEQTTLWEHATHSMTGLGAVESHLI